MMISKCLARHFHLKFSCRASEKSQLAALRKKTGYTFTNCKKALELHNNDLTQAEKWLNRQAQTLGWSKATKLEGRQTTQGLIAAVVNNNSAALVEINCETDFVAKNATFQEMAEKTANACLKFIENQHCNGTSLMKSGLDEEQLRQLPSVDGKALADHLALAIGSFGENATLRRAICLKTPNSNIHLFAYAHPSGTERKNVLLGRFAGIIALKHAGMQQLDMEQLGKALCQHVVGMNPKKIGTSDDEKAANPDDEICLIHQEYLLDNNFTVKDILEENALEILDFKRFECGENCAIEFGKLLSTVETCQ